MVILKGTHHCCQLMISYYANRNRKCKMGGHIIKMAEGDK